MLALAFACGCTRHEPREPPEAVAQVPVEPPRRWGSVVGSVEPSGPGLIVGGAGFLVGRAPTLLAMLEVAAIELPIGLQTRLDDARPVTATLGRVVGSAALHHRLHVPTTDLASWLSTVPTEDGPRCAALPATATCVRWNGWTLGLRDDGDALLVDAIEGRVRSEHERIRNEIVSAERTAVVPLEALRGQVIAWVDATLAADALTHRGATLPPRPPSFRSMTLQWSVVANRRHRGQVEWTRAQAWPTPPRSDASLPSMSALCDGAVVCGRTGAWPNPADAPSSGEWVLPPLEGPDAAALALLSWPFVVDASARRARAAVPEAARGFVDGALAQLAGVHGSGLRAVDPTHFIAFVRADAGVVNFVSGVLAYAGLPPKTVTLSNGAQVSWTHLPGAAAGLLLALDDGPDPERGWIALTSQGDMFVWLVDAPKTLASDPGFEVHLEPDAAAALGLRMRGPVDVALSAHGPTLRADVRAESTLLLPPKPSAKAP